MLLLFLITCITPIILLKFLSLNPLPPWASDLRLLSLWFWKEFSSSSSSSSFNVFGLMKNSSLSSGRFLQLPSKMDKALLPLKTEDDAETSEMSVLDLPELVLELILERLPPEGLCSMAAVCSSLRDRCISDHFWDRHMKQKWGRIIGSAAYREWQWHMASRKDSGLPRPKGLMRFVSRLLPLFRIWSKLDDDDSKRKMSLPIDSIMSWYIALESGRFWFPAQVYNRENGHVGFMLSCYDAELSYDSRTDTFRARYPPHGRRAIAVESGVSWERIRAPPVDTPPHDLHISDCLNELCPGDHIEIQWRRNKEFPYGWWYGVVGHLESCDRNENYCRCQNSDTVVLEFNQYTPGSRWRHSTINRKYHREEGNEADGFYGGIRKLCSKEEISIWKRLWPTEVLE